MLDRTLATQLDTDFSRSEQALRTSILKIIDDHASRGFSSLQGPAIGRIVEACDRTMEQAYDVALKLLQEHLKQCEPDERFQRVLAILPQMEQRLMRLAVTPASYIDSLDGVTPPELASRVPLFLSRLQSAANSTR
jgi:hypothetical protein